MRYLAQLVFMLAVAAGLSGCASMEQMAKQQDDYNRNRCHDQYGLNPGTAEYARCVSMGANAYAEAQKNPPAPAAAATGGALIVIPTGSPPNNACSVPNSPKGQCAGCSVSCGTKHASCTPGTEWPDGSGCIKNAQCECN